MTEPVSDTAPISAPITASASVSFGGAASAHRQACNECRTSSTAPIAAAEPPPMPLNSATICGMSVIATRLPQAQFRPTPMTMAASIRPMLCRSGSKKVATVAISMPTPAHWMPLRAVFGVLIRCRPSRNSVAAMK